MPPTLQELGIDRMSTEDRIALAEAIWNSLESEGVMEVNSDSHRLELERRLTDSVARPDAVTSWEVVKARALAKARK